MKIKIIKFNLLLLLILTIAAPLDASANHQNASKEAYFSVTTSLDGESQNYSLGVDFNFNEMFSLGVEQTFYNENNRTNYATQFVASYNIDYKKFNFSVGGGCGASYGDGKSFGGYTFLLSPRISADYFFNDNFYLGVDFQYHYFASPYVESREYLGINSGFIW